MPEATLGSRIRQALREAGVTQKVACRRIGISEASMTTYVKDIHPPKLKVLHEIAKITGKSIEWFLSGKGLLEPTGEPKAVMIREPSAHYHALISAIESDSNLRYVVEELVNHPHTKDLFCMVLKGRRDGRQALKILIGALEASIELTPETKENETKKSEE